MFRRLRDAHQFCSSVGALLHPIWACKVRNPKFLLIKAMNPGDYERFWKSFPDPDVPTRLTPTGTVIADAVKLLKRVH